MTLSMTTESLPDGHTLLTTEGDIDVYSAIDWRDKIIALIKEGTTKLIVDLTKVQYLDSTGLGALVGLLKRVRFVEGHLGLVVAERIWNILRKTGTAKIFDVYASVEDALSGNKMDPESAFS